MQVSTTYRTPAGPHNDLSAARKAVATGLDVDDTAELLYRDWLRIEHAAGNRPGLHTAPWTGPSTPQSGTSLRNG